MNKPVFREFWEGLTQPSRTATTITWSISAFAFSAIIAVGTYFTDLYPYFASDAKDTYVELSGQVLNLDDRRTSSPSVAIIGASALRQGLVTDAQLSDLLSAEARQPVQAMGFFGSALSSWEILAVLERVAPKLTGLVVIEVNPLRIAQAGSVLADLTGSPRLGFTTTFIDKAMREFGQAPPLRTGWHGWDNIGFILARAPYLLKNIWRGPVVFERYRCLGRGPTSPKRLDQQARIMRKQLADYDRGLEMLLPVLKKELDRHARPGQLQLALLESPVNPRFIDEVAGKELYDRHWQRLQAFADREGIPYIRLASNDRIPLEQFRDWFHICDPSAVGLSRELASKAVQLLPAPPEGDEMK